MSRTVSQTKLPKLMLRCRGRCEQCGKRMIMVRTVAARRQLVGKPSSHVKWITKSGTIAKMPVATVEHVTRREDGGRHALANLRALCWQCNAYNNNVILKSRVKDRNLCSKCGLPFPKSDRKWRKCGICSLGFNLFPAMLGYLQYPKLSWYIHRPGAVCVNCGLVIRTGCPYYNYFGVYTHTACTRLHLG